MTCLLLAAYLTMEARAGQENDSARYDPAYPVEIPPIGPFYGVRLRGLGGAYTAVAEGPEGTLTTLASIANRRPDEAGFFHWAGALSAVFPASYLDIGNNGRGTSAGYDLLAAGLLLRFGPVGLGLFLEGMGVTDRAGTGRAIHATRSVLGAAWALPGHSWVVGAGLHTIGYRIELPSLEAIEGGGPYLGADVLWRPLGRSYRAGASFKMAGRADLPADIEGIPPSIVRPWELSVGVAYWLGDGILNKPMASARGQEGTDPAIHGLLLSADVFVMGPPPGGGLPVAGLEAFFEDELQITRPRATMGVRVGGETEPISGRVRIRAGSWVEPSRFEDVLPRLHWTGGLDLYLFQLLGYDLRASLAFDLAVRYRVAGVSLGFW